MRRAGHQAYFRLPIALIGFAGVFIALPWVPLVCVLILSARYRAWEAILLGLLADFVWLPTLSWGHLPLVTMLALLIVWGFEPLRAQFLIPQ